MKWGVRMVLCQKPTKQQNRLTQSCISPSLHYLGEGKFQEKNMSRCRDVMCSSDGCGHGTIQMEDVVKKPRVLSGFKFSKASINVTWQAHML